MQTWLDIWERLLLLNGSLMLFVLGALAVCTAIELVAPAEQGRRHRTQRHDELPNLLARSAHPDGTRDDTDPAGIR